MKNTAKRRKLCTVLLLTNIAFIWGNSLLPGSVSGALSNWVGEILAMFFPGAPTDPVAGRGLLRKLAHFTEFACLGGLLAWRLCMARRFAALAVAGGFFVACIDEGIQLFVPDRGPSFLDVLLDTAGTLLGMSVLVIGYTIHRKRQIPESEEQSL